MGKSKITIDIDLDTVGKHVGYARFPHSVDRSAYGWLPIPIASIKNGNGPTVLLMAGSHGDEYEGQVILTRLLHSLSVEDIQGQVIFLPMANYPAAKSGTRVSPLDQGNLNRLYPGDENGTVTLAIAHFIETELMSRAALVLDLHSGGSSLHYLAASTMIPQADPVKHQEALRLLNVFGLPYGLIFPNGGIGSSFDAAGRNGILRVGTELGGRGWINPAYRQMCEDGVRRILADQGILSSDNIKPADSVDILQVEKKGYVYAMASGLFESAVSLGDHVKSGDHVGEIYFPSELARNPLPVHAQADGIVICERAMSMCETGDCLLHLAKSM